MLPDDDDGGGGITSAVSACIPNWGSALIPVGHFTFELNCGLKLGFGVTQTPSDLRNERPLVTKN